MSLNFLDPDGEKLCGRVLFTGNGVFVIDDLMRHLPNSYQAEKRPMTERALTEALRIFRPHTIVICLVDEPRESLRLLSSILEGGKLALLPLIAIGNDSDCETFSRNVFQKYQKIFTRPLDSSLFAETLEAFVRLRLTEEQRQTKENAEKKEANSAQEPSEEELLAVDAALTKKVQRMNRLNGRKMVLVVDDDTRMLNVIKLYLQDLYDVTLVPSGKLALKFLSKKRADLVLLDYMMPVEDGPTVLRQIRENALQTDIPVLFLTGVADKDLVMRGLEYHPKGYMLKPVTKGDLLEKVTEIVLDL